MDTDDVVDVVKNFTHKYYVGTPTFTKKGFVYISHNVSTYIDYNEGVMYLDPDEIKDELYLTQLMLEFVKVVGVSEVIRNTMIKTVVVEKDCSVCNKAYQDFVDSVLTFVKTMKDDFANVMRKKCKGYAYVGEKKVKYVVHEGKTYYYKPEPDYEIVIESIYIADIGRDYINLKVLDGYNWRIHPNIDEDGHICPGTFSSEFLKDPIGKLPDVLKLLEVANLDSCYNSSVFYEHPEFWKPYPIKGLEFSVGGE